MKEIWRYQFDITDTVEIKMPAGAEIISVQTKGARSTPCMWAIVEPRANKETRTFKVFGTGHPIPDDLALKFLDTFQVEHLVLVFHVFELVQPIN